MLLLHFFDPSMAKLNSVSSLRNFLLLRYLRAVTNKTLVADGSINSDPSNISELSPYVYRSVHIINMPTEV